MMGRNDVTAATMPSTSEAMAMPDLGSGAAGAPPGAIGAFWVSDIRIPFSLKPPRRRLQK